ncbi:MAG: type II toxin-antitoxin system VapC family toxin [Gaiellaceae bacterium]
MTIVVDASFTVPTCTAPDGFDHLADDLVAPDLLWPEVRSVLHRSAWRGVVTWDIARQAMLRLDRLPIRAVRPRALGPEAWAIADELGWAKTYDAEYLAVARLSRARLLTLDRRMRRAADRVGVETAEI